MAYALARTDKEITDVLDAAVAQQADPDDEMARDYAEGVRDAVQYLTGLGDWPSGLDEDVR